VLVKEGVNATHLADLVGLDKGQPQDGQLRDVTPVVLDCKARAILVCSVYFTVGHGLAGDNLAKMGTIASWLELYGVPYLLVGDFNVTADVMQASEWVSRIGGVVVRPSGAKTCYQGSGSLIHYGICSPGALEVLKAMTARAVEWRPQLWGLGDAAGDLGSGP